MERCRTVLLSCALLQTFLKFLLLLDASIDFLTHFQLVDPVKLEPYARAFVVEDEDMDAVITYKVNHNHIKRTFICV